MSKIYYTVREIAFKLDMCDKSVRNHLYNLGIIDQHRHGKIRVPYEKIHRFCVAVELSKLCGMKSLYIAKLTTIEIKELITKLKEL